MELNDNEFDATFRKKVFDAEPEFDESAWDKMEQRLRKRDRLVLLKRAAIACVLLLTVAGIYLFLPGNGVVNKKAEVATINKDQKNPTGKQHVTGRTDTIEVLKPNPRTLKQQQYAAGRTPQPVAVVALSLQEKATVIKGYSLAAIPNLSVSADTLKSNLPDLKLKLPDVVIGPLASVKEKGSVIRRKFPISLSLSAGPEFNSASSVFTGKTGLSAGLSVGVKLNKKLNLLAGFKYSLKDYNAGNYDYKFANERIQDLISNVEASCSVLEIPIQASYTVSENRKRSIDLNVGISSYLMLKEDYTFKYTSASGIGNRFLEKRNENQHFLSVIDLSATYFIKQGNNKLKLGFEPFVKIPLTGVGEGKVNLKSSGISLKLRYDLDKKNN